MHSSLTVADYLLKKVEDNKKTNKIPTSLTPMQLIKLVYLCHGWMLGLYGRPLLVDVTEAWRYGPVIPELYRAIKHFRNTPVVGNLVNDRGEFSAEEKSVMDQVLDIYGRYSGLQLSGLTHAEGTPWSKAYNKGKEVIPNELIREHFFDLAEEYRPD